MSIGEKLKEGRKKAGLSQEQLAEKLRVSRQAITKWESNRGMPDRITSNFTEVAFTSVFIESLLKGDSNSVPTNINHHVCLL